MARVRFRSVKPEIRVVGVDDGVFVPHTRGMCDVFGVVFRGACWFEGIMRTRVEVDGMDATEKIGGMIVGSPHFGQLRVVLLDGVTFAGFNVVDVGRLFELTGLPVIAVTRELPDFVGIRRALGNLPFGEERWRMLGGGGGVVRVVVGRKGMRKGVVFVRFAGLDLDVVREVLGVLCVRGDFPEVLRVAHLVASGCTGGLGV